jgi:hypothetical protein
MCLALPPSCLPSRGGFVIKIFICDFARSRRVRQAGGGPTVVPSLKCVALRVQRFVSCAEIAIASHPIAGGSGGPHPTRRRRPPFERGPKDPFDRGAA